MSRTNLSIEDSGLGLLKGEMAPQRDGEDSGGNSQYQVTTDEGLLDVLNAMRKEMSAGLREVSDRQSAIQNEVKSLQAMYQ